MSVIWLILGGGFVCLICRWLGFGLGYLQNSPQQETRFRLFSIGIFSAIMTSSLANNPSSLSGKFFTMLCVVFIAQRFRHLGLVIVCGLLIFWMWLQL